MDLIVGKKYTVKTLEELQQTDGVIDVSIHMGALCFQHKNMSIVFNEEMFSYSGKTYVASHKNRLDGAKWSWCLWMVKPYIEKHQRLITFASKL